MGYLYESPESIESQARLKYPGGLLMRMAIVVLGILALLAGAGGWYWRSGAFPRVVLRVARVARGDQLSSIEATGTLEPEEVVDVGPRLTA